MHKYIFFSNKHDLCIFTSEIACHKQNVPSESFLIVISNSKFFYHQLPFSFYLFSLSNVNSSRQFQMNVSINMKVHIYFQYHTCTFQMNISKFKLIFIITLPR